MDSELILAKWTDRFFAWIVDFIIISTVSTAMVFLVFGTTYYESDGGIWAENTQYIPASALFLAYWIILEYKTGQSIGKKILNLKVVSLKGGKPSLKGIILSSFGKSFLLPIDVIVGRILTNQKRQRIFNKLGDTIIIKIKEREDGSGTAHLKD